VALLAAGAESDAAMDAAGALRKLANSATIRGAIGKAGGIPPLVELLAAGAESEAALYAAGALRQLALDTTNKDTNRDKAMDESRSCGAFKARSPLSCGQLLPPE